MSELDDEMQESVDRWGSRIERYNYVMSHVNIPLTLMGLAAALYFTHHYLSMGMYAAAYWALIGVGVFFWWFQRNLIDVLETHGYVKRVERDEP